MTRRLIYTLAFLQAMTVPCAAQGPITRSLPAAAAAAAQAYPVTRYTTAMRSPVMFWTGVAVVSSGAVVTVAAVTWAEQSDLSHEDVNTRLGRDLAPCGTDPTITRLPIADCKANTGLLLLGSSLAIGGGLLMIIGGQTVQITQVGPRAFAARIRF